MSLTTDPRAQFTNGGQGENPVIVRFVVTPRRMIQGQFQAAPGQGWLALGGRGRQYRSVNFVAVTRLRLRHWRFLPAFAWYAGASMRQARQSAGHRFSGATKDAGLGFWTITVWEEEAAMRFFRNHGAHQKAMLKLAEWCDEATYVHWVQPGETPPSLAEAVERLIREGVVSRVKYPSPHHASRSFPMPAKKTHGF